MPRTGDRLVEEIKRAKRAGDRGLEQALKQWGRLPRPVQAALVREIALTRAAELRLAYPNIIGLAHGDRRRRGEIVDDQCVTFLVERKWKRQVAPKGRNAWLPRFLWVYGPSAWSGNRVLCAVPTDVEAVTDGRPIPHFGQGVGMMAPGRSFSTGAVACAVRLPEKEGVHGLTCFHVAAMPDRGGSAVDSATATLRDQTTPVGQFWRRWAGRLSRPPIRSLDVAVLQVKSPEIAAFRGTVGGFSASTSLQAGETLPMFGRILVPDRAPVPARYTQTWHNYDQIMYFDNNSQPVHREVLEFELKDPNSTGEGDSGCAVVNDSGTQFLGIYIAGIRGTGRRFVLPAYEVLDGEGYGRSGTLTIEPCP